MGGEPRGFERTVADAFRKRGARVRHDVLLAGSQIDVVVDEFTPSGLPIVTVVECKAYGRSVGIDQVRAFVVVAQNLRIAQVADKFAMVGEHGFSPNAREAAEGANIALLELEDLSSFGQEAGRVLDTSATVWLAQIGAVTQACRTVLRTPSVMSTYDLEPIIFQMADLLERLDLTSASLRAAEPRGAEQRRHLSTLTRAMNDLERCLDTASGLQQVLRDVDDARQVGLPVGASEADRATAEAVRRREVDTLRGQFRTLLRRVDDTVSRNSSKS